MSGGAIRSLLVCDRLPGDVPERLDARVAQLGELLRGCSSGGLEIVAGADHRSPEADWWRSLGVAVEVGPVDPDRWSRDRQGSFDVVVLMAPGGRRAWLEAVDRWQPQAAVIVDAFGLPGCDRPADRELFSHRAERAGVDTLEHVRAEADRALVDRADLVLAAHPSLVPAGAHDAAIVPMTIDPLTPPGRNGDGRIVALGAFHRGVHEPVESGVRLLLPALERLGEVAVLACSPVTPPVDRSAFVEVVPVERWRSVLREARVCVVASESGPPQEPVVAAALASGVGVVATRHAAGFLADSPGVVVVSSGSELEHALRGNGAAPTAGPSEMVGVGEDIAPFVAALRRIGVLVEPFTGIRPALDLLLADPIPAATRPVELFRHRDTLSHVPASASLTYRPRISVVMPCYDSDPDLLREAIESVRAQTYDRWELILVDDGSPGSAVFEVADEYARRDRRITFVALDDNRGIAGATDAGIELTTGEFVAFLDHDDLFTGDALAWVVEALNRDPGIDALYSDEAKIDAAGQWVQVFHKPAWSPELLLAYNYVTHLRVYRRSLLEGIDAHRVGFDGSQDHDLALRVAEITDRVAHIPRVLYGWRVVAGSAAAGVDEKPSALVRGRRAVRDALARRGIDGHVEPALDPHAHRVRYHHSHRPAVAIVIPTRDRAELLRSCVERIEEVTDYGPRRYLVVDNESVEPETMALFAELRSTIDLSVISYPHRFSYARMMNLAMEMVDTELALMLNNDTTPVNPEWMSAMVELAMRSDVGAVGARLLFPSGAVQHEGINIGIGGCAANVCNNHYFSLGKLVRECSAVTAACVMIRPSVFWEVGGFDERLRVAFNDVDLTWRIHRSGRRVLYTPYAELVHAESASRGSLHPLEDEGFFDWRWGPWRDLIDPFYNPNLSRWHPYEPLADDVRP